MPKVLLVEDDRSMDELIGTLLEMEGYQAIHLDGRADFEEILTLARQELPDLFLMDVHLYGREAFPLLAAIREDERLAAARVMMYSGMALGAECLRQGADDFILKPFMPDELLGRVKRILQGN